MFHQFWNVFCYWKYSKTKNKFQVIKYQVTQFQVYISVPDAWKYQMHQFQVSQFHLSKKSQFQVSKIPSVHSKGRSLVLNFMDFANTKSN